MSWNKEEDYMVEQLIAYRAGTLSDSEQTRVMEKLTQSEVWKTTLEELDYMDQVIDQAPLVVPSKSSKERFEQLLAKEEETRKLNSLHITWNARRSWLNVAAVIALLVFGLGIGHQVGLSNRQQEEIAQLREEVREQKKLLALSLLKQNSASDRIKGVNISLKETTVDDQILLALINRMNIDQNLNVKIKAIEGLSQFGDNDLVIPALIKALKQQKSPEVQIAIMEVLLDLKVKAAYGPFQEILRDEEAIDAVKNKAASGLEILL